MEQQRLLVQFLQAIKGTIHFGTNIDTVNDHENIICATTSCIMSYVRKWIFMTMRILFWNKYCLRHIFFDILSKKNVLGDEGEPKREEISVYGLK